MPITGEVSLEELLAEILKISDRSAVVAGLQAKAQPIFQSIFDKGHAAAVSKLQPEKTQLEGTVAQLNEMIRQQTDQIKQLGEKAPDLAALQATHTDNIRRLEEKHENKLKEISATLNAERMSRAERDLVAHLISTGVDSEYAEVVLEKAKRGNRLRHNPKGIVEAFRADTDAPFTPTQDKDGLKLLAEELKTGVPPRFITVNGDTGSGTETGASDTGGKGKTKFDAVRQEVRKKEEARGPSGGTARDRLAGVGAGEKAKS